MKDFQKGNSFTSLYCVSKELNVPPLSAKCAIAQVRCFFKKWKNSKCIISDLLRDISRCRSHAWDKKESKILADKLDKFSIKKSYFKLLLGWQENQSKLRLIKIIILRKLERYLKAKL